MYKVEYKTAEGTDFAQNKALVDYTLEVFGRIDVLILCAGVSAHAMFADMEDLSMLRKTMEVNLWAPIMLTKLCLDTLRKHKGQIIVVNSISGVVGSPYRSGYCASKFALRGFYDSLTREYPEINTMHFYPPYMIGTNIRKNNLAGPRQEEDKPNFMWADCSWVADILIQSADLHCCNQSWSFLTCVGVRAF